MSPEGFVLGGILMDMTEGSEEVLKDGSKLGNDEEVLDGTSDSFKEGVNDEGFEGKT